MTQGEAKTGRGKMGWRRQGLILSRFLSSSSKRSIRTGERGYRRTASGALTRKSQV